MVKCILKVQNILYLCTLYIVSLSKPNVRRGRSDYNEYISRPNFQTKPNFKILEDYNEYFPRLA